MTIALILEELRFTVAQYRIYRMTRRRFFGILPPQFKSRQDAEQYLRQNTPVMSQELVECGNYLESEYEVFTYHVSPEGEVYDEGSPQPAGGFTTPVQALNPDQALRYVLGKVW